MKIAINRHAPEFLVVVAKLLPLLQRYRPFSMMDFDDLADHLAWYWNKGTLGYLLNDWGHPRGVCLIKLFGRLEQFLTPYVHEPCGKFVFVEMMAVDDPIAFSKILEVFIGRFGPQEIVLWDRGERTENGAPRMYRWKDYLKLVRRLTYGVAEMERI